MKTLIMTGGSGFMGQAWLNRHGHQYKLFNLGRSCHYSGPNFTHIPCDLADPVSVKSVLQGHQLPSALDGFLHLAVSRLHRDFPSSAMDMFEINVGAFARLMDFAHRAGAAQVVLGSTGSVYDGLDEDNVSDDRPLSPTKYFPATKLSAELLAAQYSEHLALTVLRFFTPYGPEQTGRLIQDLAARIRSGSAVSLPATGGGMAVCGIYIDDVVQILEHCLTTDARGTYNVAGHDRFDIETLALCIGRIIGIAPVFERDMSRTVRRVTPDLSSLRKLIDPKRLTAFEDGLRLCLKP
jgi:UDP-glucose 4-epimerase